MSRLVLAAATALLVAAAIGLALATLPKPPEAPVKAAVVFAPVDFADLPGWREDDVAAARPALELSCRSRLRRPSDQPVGPGGVAGRVADWRAACTALAALPPDDAVGFRRFLEEHFAAWAVSDAGNPEGLFTGYYEAQLNGAREASDVHATPLLARPDDLVTVDLGRFRDDWRGQRVAGRVDDGQLVPYHDRAAIEAGALADRGLALVWVDDPVEAFFLHIQGSGRVALPDGGELRVGYAAQNGHPYYAIGRELLKRGHLESGKVNADSIKAWLRAHPALADEVMNTNRSYVFFRELTGPGPIGAEGLPLTAGRSLAVDRSVMPLGAPVWIDTLMPDAASPLRRLMVAQDTGGAIRGAVRGDVFFGHGTEAEGLASGMAERGRWFLLLPRGVVPPGSA